MSTQNVDSVLEHLLVLRAKYRQLLMRFPPERYVSETFLKDTDEGLRHASMILTDLLHPFDDAEQKGTAKVPVILPHLEMYKKTLSQMDIMPHKHRASIPFGSREEVLEHTAWMIDSMVQDCAPDMGADYERKRLWFGGVEAGLFMGGVYPLHKLERPRFLVRERISNERELQSLAMVLGCAIFGGVYTIRDAVTDIPLVA